MTQTGINRRKYVAAHGFDDPRPSRFTEPIAYTEWAARADAWAEREGLNEPRKPRRPLPEKAAPRAMTRTSHDTWILKGE